MKVRADVECFRWKKHGRSSCGPGISDRLENTESTEILMQAFFVLWAQEALNLLEFHSTFVHAITLSLCVLSRVLADFASMVSLLLRQYGRISSAPAELLQIHRIHWARIHEGRAVRCSFGGLTCQNLASPNKGLRRLLKKAERERESQEHGSTL